MVRRLHALDLLRFVAALAVVAHHWGWVVNPSVRAMPLYPAYVARYGQLGVELFFIISGFVILMSAQGTTLKQFVIARAVRLYPAFWVCCTVTALFLLGDPLGPSADDYIVNMTMLPEANGAPFIDGVYWTLATEMKFYFIVAMLIFVGMLHRIEPVLWIWLASSVLGISTSFRTLVVADYAAFFIGGCACFLLRAAPSKTRLALLIAAVVAAIPGPLQRAAHFAAAHHVPYEPRLVSSMIVAFFAIVLGIAKDWIRMPAWRLATVAAAVSYPLYLLHARIGYELFALANPGPAGYAGCTYG